MKVYIKAIKIDGLGVKKAGWRKIGEGAKAILVNRFSLLSQLVDKRCSRLGSAPPSQFRRNLVAQVISEDRWVAARFLHGFSDQGAYVTPNPGGIQKTALIIPGDVY